MNIEYVIKRLIRRLLPGFFVRFLLRRNLIIEAGYEANSPKQAVAEYLKEIKAAGGSFAGARVLNFGFGGFLGVAVELLKQGAGHVYLYDKYAAIDYKKNRALLKEYREFFSVTAGSIRPRPEYITVIKDDLEEFFDDKERIKPDIVLSRSVFEHLEDVDGLTGNLFAITADKGVNIHFIDLRDHFFKFSFHMLSYSDRIWRGFLNPGSNLNRVRVPGYERVFKKHFNEVKCHILGSDLEGFLKIKNKIKPQFVTGDDRVDSASGMVIVAKK